MIVPRPRSEGQMDRVSCVKWFFIEYGYVFVALQYSRSFFLLKCGDAVVACGECSHGACS